MPGSESSDTLNISAQCGRVCGPVFSTIIGRDLKMFYSDWLDLDLSVTLPALLCHKDPALGTQNPSIGALGRNSPDY